MEGEDRELAYYRSVEDLFSSLRGAPHVLSPRDFQLLRSWWRDGVPLAAVAAALNEVFARARERDEDDPVASLSYCRHAVKRHAKRIAEMHVGGSTGGTDPEDEADGLRRLGSLLRATAAELADRRPTVADVLSGIVQQLVQMADEMPAAMLDEQLYALESAMLHACWRALHADDRRDIDDRIETAVAASATSEEARGRSVRALRDRELRLLLGLPRLEIGG